MLPAATPWSIARRAGVVRRTLMLLMLGTLLFGLGVQAARACLPTVLATHAHAADADGGDGAPCHGEAGVVQLVCESHCRADTQSARLSFGFDLPAAAPLDAPRPAAPLLLAALDAGDNAAPPPGSGPPLHLLFHRFLR